MRVISKREKNDLRLPPLPPQTTFFARIIFHRTIFFLWTAKNDAICTLLQRLLTYFFAQVQSNNETQICLTTGYVNKFDLPGLSHYISRVPLVGNHCLTAFDFASMLKSAFLPNFRKAETLNESTVKLPVLLQYKKAFSKICA